MTKSKAKTANILQRLQRLRKARGKTDWMKDLPAHKTAPKGDDKQSIVIPKRKAK